MGLECHSNILRGHMDVAGKHTNILGCHMDGFGGHSEHVGMS